MKRFIARGIVANSWFRLYSEFAHDPKVQTMPVAMQRHLVMLFCLRCEGKPLRKYDDEEIAYFLQITPLELPQVKSLLMKKGFIDNSWEIVNWDKRQYVSDSSTERVRQYRERMKQDETLPKRDVTENVTVPDTDTEQNRVVRKEPDVTLADLFPSEQQEPLKPKETKSNIWIQIWNENRGSLPEIRKITSDITKEITARAKEYSNEEFSEAVQMCATLPFLKGENDRNWKATLGWLLRGKTSKNDGAVIGQVLNGKYGERPKPPIEYEIVEVSPQKFWADTGIHVS